MKTENSSMPDEPEENQKVRTVLTDILRAFRKEDPNLEQESYYKRLDEARADAGNDMIEHVRKVFPVLTEIQLHIMSRHGLSNGNDNEERSKGDEIIRFLNRVKKLEESDSEVARLYSAVKAYFIPPMTK